jgi:Ribonuclease G/E
MINQNDQLSLLEYLDTQIKINLNESQIIQISEIGLVEITRKRKEKNVYDTFAQRKSNHCQETCSV